MRSLILLLVALSIVFVAPMALADWNSTLETGLVAYYNFEESSGDLIDTFSGKYNMTLYNAPTQNIGGKISKGYSFEDSSSQYTQVTQNITEFNSDLPFSLNIWVYRTKVERDNIATIASSTEGNNFVTLIASETVFCGGSDYVGSHSNDGITDYIACGNQTLSDGSWHMITLVVNSTRAKLYENGLYVGISNIDYQADVLLNQDVFVFGSTSIGGGHNAFYNGTLDEAGLWNRSLTEEEITILYNSGTGLSYPPSMAPPADTTPPSVVIVTPTNGSTFTAVPIYFNITTDENSTAKYSLNDGAINYTLTSDGAGTSHKGSNSSMASGIYTVKFYVADIAGNTNSTQSTFNLSIPVAPPVYNCTIIPSSQYTVSGGSIIANSNSTYLGENVNVSSTYSYSGLSSAGQVAKDTTDSIATTTSWFTIIIVIVAMVVLIGLTVMIINAIRSSGFLGGQ